jgi:glycosyltransferase involved in cell wall biosynthesis
VSVVGDGWWADELTDAARRIGVDDIVDFLGFASEDVKHAELARAWVLALPSLKEGWGLVVLEAAGYAVPSVGYRNAGGVAESVVDGVTGLLADDQPGFTQALDRLLTDARLRRKLGYAAEARSWEFGWDTAARSFGRVLAEAAGRATASVADPEPLHVHLEHRHEPDDVTPTAAAPEGRRPS